LTHNSSRRDPDPVVARPPDGALLAGLTVVVDGSGPVVGLIAASLRTIGVGRLRTGTYAAEPDLWTRAPLDPVEQVAAVVFVRTTPLHSLVAAPWWRAGVTHLPLVVAGERAEIGPLVVPGSSSCVRCHEIFRGGRAGGGRGPTDPGVSARAIVPAPPGPPAAAAAPRGRSGAPPDPGTAALAAAVAAVTLRAVLHGDRDLVGVSSEVHASRPEVLHRHWPRQPDCPCTAGEAGRAGVGRAGSAAAQWTMGA
jgi:hypothetical protein